MELPWTTVAPAEGDVLVMASRFRLRGIRRSPRFLLDALRLRRQALRAPGAVGVALRARPLRGEFWTLSAWTDRAALQDYAAADPHAAVRARAARWTSDAAFVFWTVPAPPASRADAAELWREGERRVAGQARTA
ncbi:hypothetical protein BTM25_42790 [Actinomadura rubteroloni]|uniref:DUF3291 domain-containing protein n=1 Tax=Actinomadura rubteroloni TaxID=1926885 RepID=A0A2P4UDJ8_9ACTN|nr:hypothetical protein [Actinomadura rubteroloni]POM23127.1 hypothetical protein BTM25_42790 [Actinomadura rubteroloni]